MFGVEPIVARPKGDSETQKPHLSVRYRAKEPIIGTVGTVTQPTRQRAAPIIAIGKGTENPRKVSIPHEWLSGSGEDGNAIFRTGVEPIRTDFKVESQTPNRKLRAR